MWYHWKYICEISLPLQIHKKPQCSVTLQTVLTPQCYVCCVSFPQLPLSTIEKAILLFVQTHTWHMVHSAAFLCRQAIQSFTSATSISNSALLIRFRLYDFCMSLFCQNTQTQAYHFQGSEPSVQQSSSWSPHFPGGSPTNEWVWRRKGAVAE